MCVPIQIFRKAVTIIEYLLDSEHKRADGAASKLREDVTAKYFTNKLKNRRSQPPNESTGDDDIGLSLSVQSRCGTACLTAVGAVIEEVSCHHHFDYVTLITVLHLRYCVL
jgi:hypothetical protein